MVCNENLLYVPRLFKQLNSSASTSSSTSPR